MTNFTGLMHYNATPGATLADKVLDTAKRYTAKYGGIPNTCYVHPSMLQGNPATPDGIAVLPSISVLPNNYWVGVS